MQENFTGSLAATARKYYDQDYQAAEYYMFDPSVEIDSTLTKKSKWSANVVIIITNFTKNILKQNRELWDSDEIQDIICC